MLNTVQQATRDARKSKTAEVFTPNKLVNQMLNKLPKEVWKKDKTFCDPAVGNGQFLFWILIRKIKRNHSPLAALKTLFGVDIMQDNIRECQWRLLKTISLFEPVSEEHVSAVLKNIVWVNPVKFPGGSLQYDFSFKNPKKEKVDRWMKKISENALGEIELPVDEAEFSPTGTFSNDLFD